MRILRMISARQASVVIGISIMLVLAGTTTIATASPIPNKFLLASHFGKEVDATTGGNVCTHASGDKCQSPAKESGDAGGFLYPLSIAVNNDAGSLSYEHVYVADRVNHRVQEFTASGQFLNMLGGNVNGSGNNICTKAEESKCQAGESGDLPGQFGYVESVAVDPTSGDVFVADVLLGSVNGEYASAERVQKFSPAGQFLLEMGKEVNETSKGNVCSAGEACKGAALQTIAVAEANSEPGAFDFTTEAGNVLTVGGAKDMVYVGDHARVQEFNAISGAPAGEISLAAISEVGDTTGVAVDPAGDVFVSDSGSPGIHEYNASGVLQSTVIDDDSSAVRGLALDPHGRIGILEGSIPRHGVLYSAQGDLISEFAGPSGSMSGEPTGLAFAASDEMYVVNVPEQEVEVYTPYVFPELRTCAASEITGTSAELCGEINPNGVHTKGFFQYKKESSSESVTPTIFESQSEIFEPVSFRLTNLEPNQVYQYKMGVEAEADGEEVNAHGGELSFHTPGLAPQISGQPSASFLTAQSAVLNASLNPEHTTTLYRFEYGACAALAGCATVQSTPIEVSSVYGMIGSSQEIVGLAPSTTYSFRLVAKNEFEEAGKAVEDESTSTEGSFTTGPAPAPSVTTGAFGAVTATSAVISGIVNPDGRPASYAFEVGVYDGTSTQYGVVFSGSAGSGSTPIEETWPLTGLQPGTTYAYRITISSGYIVTESHTLQGGAGTFTTTGLPAALSLPPVLGQLPIPKIAFPKTTPSTTRTLTQAQKLANALKACAKKAKDKRAACKQAARKKYPVKTKSKKK
jgi:hypothetical protein